MIEVTQEWIDSLPRDGKGRVLVPTGEYASTDWTLFGECFVFGDGCNFVNRCKFGDWDNFGDVCVFDYGCLFGNGCEFGHWCVFDYGCLFGDECKFGDGCKFGNDSVFGYKCSFGNGCEFGNVSKFGNDSVYLGIKCNNIFCLSNIDGSGRQVKVATDGNTVMVEAGCFVGTAEEFCKKVLSEGKIVYAKVIEAVAGAIVTGSKKETHMNT